MYIYIYTYLHLKLKRHGFVYMYMDIYVRPALVSLSLFCQTARRSNSVQPLL